MGVAAAFGHIGDERVTTEWVVSRPGPQDATVSEAYLLRRAQRVHGAAVALTGPAALACTLSIRLNGVQVGVVNVEAGERVGSAIFPANAGYAGAQVTARWTANPPSSGCTVHVDLD